MDERLEQEDAQAMGWGHRLLLTSIGTGYLATLHRSWRDFLAAADRPWKTQADLLASFLLRHRDTAYGIAHRFGELRDVRAFQDRVPIVDYEALRPWIDRIARGEGNVLSPSPVTAFERTSGTTGGGKLIPLDPSFLAEISRATSPWLFAMYASRPQLIGTTAYWSISPVAREFETTAGGIPIGLPDDTAYFGPAERWALKQMMAVPSRVAHIRSIDEWRAETARLLAADRDLGFISVWNPSFLTLLMKTVEEKTGRAASELWPRLRLISCWTDGHAARFVPEMAAHFPGVEIEGKGLLATEGVITFPLGGERVVAVRSHFLEFEDLEHPNRRPLLVDQLRAGGRYAPIVTAGNGFCRYRLSDEVECTGMFARTPSLRFVGKLDRVSDLCGEKITAAEVDRALDRAGEFAFALLAPSAKNPPHYRLYLEGGSLGAAERVEAALCENHHYKYCRDLGQLGPVVPIEVKDGWRIYERAMIDRGMKAGDIKPTHLDTRTIWEEIFGR